MNRLQTLTGIVAGVLLAVPGCALAQRSGGGVRSLPAGPSSIQAAPAFRRGALAEAASRLAPNSRAARSSERAAAAVARRGAPRSGTRTGSAATENFRVNGNPINSGNSNNRGRVFDQFPSQNPVVVPGDFTPVPGLGFDIPHLAATQGPNAVGAGNIIHTGGGSSGVLFPFLGGGYYEPESMEPEEAGQSADTYQTAVEEQSSVSAESAAEAARRDQLERDLAIVSQSLGSSGGVARPAGQEPPQTAEPTKQAALREASEYVFVKRDGGLVFAVAYSWEGATLRYITRDGFRRSLAAGALDLEATRQFNEQRGLAFRAPV